MQLLIVAMTVSISLFLHSLLLLLLALFRPGTKKRVYVRNTYILNNTPTGIVYLALVLLVLEAAPSVVLCVALLQTHHETTSRESTSVSESPQVVSYGSSTM